MSNLFNNGVLALILFALLQVADVFTTLQGLRRGAREANPVIAWFMRHLGRYGWVIVKLALSGLAAVWLYQAGVIWMIWLLCVYFAYVVYRNHRVKR